MQDGDVPPAVTVRRMSTAASAPAARDLAVSDLPVSLEQLLSGVASPRDVRSDVKVFRVHQDVVNVKETDVDLSLSYIQIWGSCDDGTFQINATWRCIWEPSDTERPRLARLNVLNYEEVVASGVMFTDCTEAVMTNSTFREQLLPGVDHRSGTIDRRLGIDIGGWQGLAIADVNGDGLDDLYCCQPGGLPNRLYVQQPDGARADHSAEAGVDWLDSSHAALLVDLDNDGDQDSVVGLDDGVLILANDGRGRFQIRAEKILPAACPTHCPPPTLTRTAIWTFTSAATTVAPASTSILYLADPCLITTPTTVAAMSCCEMTSRPAIQQHGNSAM